MADNCDTGACDPHSPAPVYRQPASVASNQSAPPHDPLNPATFVAPRIGETAPSVVIEFCDRVRRALLLSFAMARADDPIAIVLSTSADGLFRSIIFVITWADPSILRNFYRLHRATWVQTELFLTFPTPALASISLVPLNSPETGGRFRVWLSTSPDPPLLVWDRKVEGGFPELKVLKQRIRDVIQPGTSLGHSDKKETD
ncbi:hypothetical protein FS749_008896 [Ceratobasidium sp. UAMH 11750]|nr:hypothetical protein FS749_008896 [Ceratobasidium sp. UAMH 11750]